MSLSDDIKYKNLLSVHFGYKFDSKEGRLSSNFRREGNSIFYDVCPESSTGYTVEVSLLDGSTRHCGFGKGCVWSDWTENLSVDRANLLFNL